MEPVRGLYRARINRGGALIADSRRLLAGWDDALDLDDNCQRAIEENLLGKGSRKQAREVVSNIRWRYLEDADRRDGLVRLVRAPGHGDTFTRVLYYLAATGDPVLYDSVTEFVAARFASGFSEVSQAGMMEQLGEWVGEGRSHVVWNEETTERVAQGVLSTLRDFEVLEGSKRRRITPPYLPDAAFALVAFLIHQKAQSGERTIADPDWRLFFLARPAVERFMAEANQLHYLRYAASGNVVRIEFPAGTFAGEVDVVTA
jgi:hypothetical protein